MDGVQLPAVIAPRVVRYDRRDDPAAQLLVERFVRAISLWRYPVGLGSFPGVRGRRRRGP